MRTVAHQPFGGARASGTNDDKAGTVWNLIRFVSPRAIKSAHVPDRDPYLPALDG
jgi:1-pyrroline-5-carboxylate dehydrogenase